MEPLPKYDPELLHQLLLKDRDRVLDLLRAEAASDAPDPKALRQIAARLEQLAILLAPYPTAGGSAEAQNPTTPKGEG